MSTTATKKPVVNLFATGTTVKPTGAKKAEKVSSLVAGGMTVEMACKKAGISSPTY